MYENITKDNRLKMGLPIYIIAIIFQLFAISIHSFGVYLIRCLFVDGLGDVQHIYILNLSIMEILCSFCFFVLNVGKIIIPSNQSLLQTFYWNIMAIILTLCAIPITLNTCYIVIDKVFEVYFNIRYHIYWNMKRTKYLQGITLIGSFSLCAFVVVIYNVYERNYVLIYFREYFRPVVTIIILILTVASYSYIFRKYRLSKRLPSRPRSSFNNQSTFTIFRRSRFLVSICLVSTFFLFVVLPDNAHYIIKLFNYTIDKEPDTFSSVKNLMYTISFLSDAYIYIFINVKIRRVLYKRLRAFGCMQRNGHSVLMRTLTDETEIIDSSGGNDGKQLVTAL